MNFSQIDFGVFGLKIYGILLALAFGLSVWHLYKKVRRLNFHLDFFIHHFWRWIMGGFLFGRLLAVLLYPQVIIDNGIFGFFMFWEETFNFFGLGIGFLVTMFFDLKKHKKPFRRWVDIIIPSFFLGLLMADLAAFITGTIYGIETSLPWGVQYETFGVEILNPVHPVSLYLFIIHFWILHWVRKHVKTLERFPGILAAKTGILFFVTDFLIHFLRADKTVMILEIIRVEQVLDLMVIIFLAYLLYAQKLKS